MVEKADYHDIKVVFPRGGFTPTTQPAPKEVLPDLAESNIANKKLSILVITLTDKARVRVIGFGMPFANGDDKEASRQVNENSPLAGDTTLLSLLSQRTFTFLVPRLPKYLLMDFSEDLMALPWSYPYGKEHHWDPERIWANHLNNRLEVPYLRELSYDDDNSHLSAVANFTALDILWVSREAAKLQKERLRAYFVLQDEHTGPEDPDCRLYIIVSMDGELWMQYKSAWALFASHATCRLGLGSDASEKWSVTFLFFNRSFCFACPILTSVSSCRICSIIEHPRSIPVLRENHLGVNHRAGNYDIALLTTPNAAKDQGLSFVPRIYGSRRKANKKGKEDWNCVSLHFEFDLRDTERKIVAINAFQSDSKPTHSSDFSDGMDLTIQERQDLHRALMRCRGFYQFMTGQPDVAGRDPIDTEGKTDPQVVPRKLPVVNYLPSDANHDQYVESLLGEVLPADRSRLRGYLMNRYLGLGILTGVSSTYLCQLPPKLIFSHRVRDLARRRC